MGTSSFRHSAPEFPYARRPARRHAGHQRLLGRLLATLLLASTAPAQVVINEVLYRTDPAADDPLKRHQWVELYNKSADPVDLTGWVVAGLDGKGGISARQLPAVTIPGQGYLVLHLAEGTDRLDFAEGSGDAYTQDVGNVWNPDMDEIGLYSTDRIVNFAAWSSVAVPYKGGPAHDDAVAAGIWTSGASLLSDGVTVEIYEKPRPVPAGSSIGRDPDSTDTGATADFEPRGGVGALDNSPGRRNQDSITVEEVEPQPLAANRAGARAANAPKKWTVMLYFNADNSLEKYIYDNIQEIEAAGGSDANVNFVLMYDGKRFSLGSQRGLIRADGDPRKLTLERVLGESAQIGERNMGDPTELAAFVEWAKAAYPAERYALILSAHGDGWKSYGPDETSPGARGFDFLYMGELQSALRGQRFDLIGFDACMMAGIEVATQLRDVTDYYVASEQTIPGFGFPYDTFSAGLR
ncbi:MAG: lamin tail domain-containing protein, partial [Acidobacteria bacterium]|nr:lamin tail domain-containing protein [Acidobacteriota bacterium]